MIIHEFTRRVDLERQMWVLSFRTNCSALNVLEPLQNIRFVLYKGKNATLIRLTSNCFLIVRSYPEDKNQEKRKKIKIPRLATHAHSHKKKKKIIIILKVVLLNWWFYEMAWPCFRGQLFRSRGITLYFFIEIKNFGRVFQKHLTLTELCSHELIFKGWPI